MSAAAPNRDAALDYAASGIPVFVLNGKKPFKRTRGFKDATIAAKSVKLMFSRRPNANVGIRTGKTSGWLVVDVDPRDGGLESLDALEAEHGPLPHTPKVLTGSGGFHLIFQYPEGVEVRNSAGKLGLGLDVRAEGGYVVAPPSIHPGTGRPYKWFISPEEVPPPPPPAWLLKRLTELYKGPLEGVGAKPTTCDEVVSRISSGRRNSTLARITGKLWRRGLSPQNIENEMLRINAEHCDPPLAKDEVRRVVRSITTLYPAGEDAPGITPEVTRLLDGLEASLFWSRDWKGQGGMTDRDVFLVLLIVSSAYGIQIPAGVRISISTRVLARLAGCSHPTVLKAVKRLELAKLIRRDGRHNGPKSGAFVLLASVVPETPRTALPLSHKGRDAIGGDWASGKDLRAPRLRWGPNRLGKTCGAILDVLLVHGGVVSLEEVASALGVGRTRDLRRRHMARLVERGLVVECGENMYRLVDDFFGALDRERDDSGEKEADERDRQRYEEQREAFRDAWLRGEVLSTAERERRKRWRVMVQTRAEYEVRGDENVNKLGSHPPESSEVRRDRRSLWQAVGRIILTKRSRAA